MRKSGIPEEHIRLTTYQNALTAFAQSGQMDEQDCSMQHLWIKLKK